MDPIAFRCAVCGKLIPPDPDWSDADARAEAEAKGIDPDDAAVVCDECYARSPWGQAPDQVRDDELAARIAGLAARLSRGVPMEDDPIDDPGAQVNAETVTLRLLPTSAVIRELTRIADDLQFGHEQDLARPRWLAEKIKEIRDLVARLEGPVCEGCGYPLSDPLLHISGCWPRRRVAGLEEPDGPEASRDSIRPPDSAPLRVEKVVRPRRRGGAFGRGEV